MGERPNWMNAPEQWEGDLFHKSYLQTDADSGSLSERSERMARAREILRLRERIAALEAELAELDGYLDGIIRACGEQDSQSIAEEGYSALVIDIGNLHRNFLEAESALAAKGATIERLRGLLREAHGELLVLGEDLEELDSGARSFPTALLDTELTKRLAAELGEGNDE